jgi:ribosomal protein S18 acetylase RimI-like enzyme
LQRLEQICFEKDAWPMLDLLTVLTFPATVRFKAVVGETMAGFISGDQRPRQQVGWITTIAVLPEYRQKGIAKALLIACEQEMGLPLVKLCVRRTNIPAQNLYQGMGYQHVDTWKRYYADSEDAWVYEKKIPEAKKDEFSQRS